jgi:hypothetical protein
MNIQRSQLAKFLPDNESIRIFEEVIRTAERADKNAGQITPILADVSADSTTLVSAGIALPVAANSIYRFEFFGAYTVASAAVGTRWVIDGPTASTLAYSSRWSLTSTSRSTTEASAYNLPAAANASSSSTGGNLVRIDGIIAPSTNGQLTLWFASGGSSLVTLKSGAFGRLIRLT